MKRTIIYMTGVVLSLSVSTASFAQDQKRSYKGDITVTPLDLKQRGDSLYVAMDFKMNRINVDSRRSAEFIPVLVSPTKTLKLPKVSVKGRNNYKNYRRAQVLMSKKQKAAYNRNSPYAVEKGYRRRTAELNYRYAMPYETWMADARLDLQRDDCGCGNTQTMAMERLVDNVSLEKIIVVEPYRITPSLAYIQPAVESIKRRDIAAEAQLDFAVGKTNIRPEYMNNPNELARIRKMIDELKGDKNIEVKGIKIIGYASPEGSLATNKRLSEGRANALKNYLASVYEFPKDIYSIEFGGENWDGLFKALNESNYDYKDQVLAIIENTTIENGREKKIMDLQGGVPYRQMLKDIFPSLRTAVCRVDYNVKNFDASEAKEVIKTTPQNLSLSEMYAVANQYEKGSQEFNDVFETAVRMFPNDETANLNAASSALARKDLVSAERYLGKVKSKVRIPERDNAMGVLEMLKGNYDKAEQYLESAKQAGITAAQTNLDEIAKKRDNMKQIEEAEAKNRTNPNYKK